MSTPQVTSNATLECSFGEAPTLFCVLPLRGVTAGALPAGTVMDHIALLNVPSFALCSAPTNPAVIALTAANLGAFTPAPCIPVLAAPWTPGTPSVSIGGIPALDTNCKLMCGWLGVITVTAPAQMTVTVP